LFFLMSRLISKRSVLISPRSSANIASVGVRVAGGEWAWIEEVIAES